MNTLQQHPLTKYFTYSLRFFFSLQTFSLGQACKVTQLSGHCDQKSAPRLTFNKAAATCDTGLGVSAKRYAHALSRHSGRISPVREASWLSLVSTAPRALTGCMFTPTPPGTRLWAGPGACEDPQNPGTRAAIHGKPQNGNVPRHRTRAGGRLPSGRKGLGTVALGTHAKNQVEFGTGRCSRGLDSRTSEGGTR